MKKFSRLLKLKITEIGLEKISHITLSGQMHSSMLLKNSKIIDGPYSWQSEKNPNTIEQISSNKNVHDLKRGYPIFNISNLDGMYATLLTKIFGDLTNNYSLIHESEASATGFFDYQNNNWDQSVISKFFPKITLPSIISGLNFIGLITAVGKYHFHWGIFKCLW